MISFLNLLEQAQTWEFIAIILFSLGSCLTLLFSFIPKERFQKISLGFFLAGAFLWLTIIFIQSGPVALSEIKKIGWSHSIFSVCGLCIASYSSWFWVKKNKPIWFACIVLGILVMIFFALNKK